MGRKRIITMVTAIGLLALAGCGSSSKSSSAGGSGDTTTTTAAAPKERPKVTIVAKDFGYTLPNSMPAGWVDVTLKNEGKTGHQIAFTKLGTVPFATYKAAAVNTDMKKLADTTFVGGPNNVEPGQSVTTTIHLEAGAYGVACYIPADSDGKTHAEHGMIGQIDVVQTADSVEDAPKVDGGSISLSEFTFQPDASFTGSGTVEIKNVGSEVHEMILVKEAAGKTVDDVKGFFLAPPGKAPAGPPPFTAAGGIVGLGPNQTMYEAMSLTPGKYVMLCFFPDPNKGNQPHVLEGMIKEITIS